MHRISTEERQEFTRELAVLAKRWRQRFDERLKQVGMTEARWSALYWLSRSPEGLSQTVLADRAGVECATLVRTLDLLEQQGLVRRQPSASDRRVNVVRLTPAAEPVMGELATLCDELSREAMDDLTFDEFQTLAVLLRRVRGRLEHVSDSGDRAAA